MSKEENRPVQFKNPSFLGEIWAFMRERKLYWLAPIIISLLLLGALIWVSSGAGALSPFLYAL